MGYKQDLNNGVIAKPSIPGPQGRAGTQQRIGKNMDFYGNIAFGENDKGQTTIAPSQVVRSGHVVYDQEDYPRGQTSERWKPKKW